MQWYKNASCKIITNKMYGRPLWTYRVKLKLHLFDLLWICCTTFRLVVDLSWIVVDLLWICCGFAVQHVDLLWICCGFSSLLGQGNN